MGHILLQAVANGSELATWVYRQAPHLVEVVEGDLCAIANAVNAREADQYDLSAFFYGLRAMSRLEGIAHAAGLDHTVRSLWNLEVDLQTVVGQALSSVSSVMTDATVESEVY